MRKYQPLLTPLSYLRLRSPDLWVFQWLLPGMIAAVGLAAYYWLPVRPPILAEKGLVALFNGLLGTLVGFYIAALAAISAFPNDSLDATMKGRAPILESVRQGKSVEEKLSRRRFLTILFGYCAFLSMMLFAIGILSIIVAPSFVDSPWAGIAKFIWLGSYLFVASSLLVTTLIGLHYLIDRMHRD